MTFADAVKTCIAKYATFSGRASRSKYWWFMLFTAIVGLTAGAIEGLINGLTRNPNGPTLISAAFGLALFIPSLAVSWRRLHDIGRSGLWYPGLLLAAPVSVGMISVGASMLLLNLADLYIGSAVQLLTLATMGSCLVLLSPWLCRPTQTGAKSYGTNPHEVSP